MLNERSKNYCKQTLAMNQTNDIRQEEAKAEVHASNLEIMAKDPDDLPNDISPVFLKLQKEEILEDLQERLKAKKKSTQEKETANSNPLNSNKKPRRYLPLILTASLQVLMPMAKAPTIKTH
jgi:hypothetical protein